MKNICKYIKLTVCAVAIGETIASYYKDEDFRKKVNEANGFDKCKLIFDNLIDLNKRFFIDVKSVDYKSMLDSKINYIDEKLDFLKKEADRLNSEKIQPILSDIMKKYSEITDIVIEKKEELPKKYLPKINELLEKINNTISEFKWKIKDKIKF